MTSLSLREQLDILTDRLGYRYCSDEVHKTFMREAMQAALQEAERAAISMIRSWCTCDDTGREIPLDETVRREFASLRTSLEADKP